MGSHLPALALCLYVRPSVITTPPPPLRFFFFFLLPVGGRADPLRGLPRLAHANAEREWAGLDGGRRRDGRGG